jgi:hypothetical protein
MAPSHPSSFLLVYRTKLSECQLLALHHDEKNCQQLLLLLSTTPARPHGYKNRSNFPKFGENRRNQIGPNLKTTENTVHYFKISGKDKN